MARKTRRRYSEHQKIAVLEVARRQGLTSAQVKKQFGVSKASFMKWRAEERKTKPGRVSMGNGSLEGLLGDAVRERVREILPALVSAEVKDYLDEVLR